MISLENVSEFTGGSAVTAPIPNETAGLILQIYRSHEGTVYSLDAFWKYGEPLPADEKRLASRSKVSPSQRLGTITLITGGPIQNARNLMD